MSRQKQVLTTGEVARICQVAPRTVSKWFDSGQLKGYRVPGSKDRRIPIQDLIRFMQSHGMPLNGLETGSIGVVIVSADHPYLNQLLESLNRQPGLDCISAGSPFGAGLAIARHRPGVVMVDSDTVQLSARQMADEFSGGEDSYAPQLVALTKDDSQAEALRSGGFNGVLSRPFEAVDAARMIAELTEG